MNLIFHSLYITSPRQIEADKKRAQSIKLNSVTIQFLLNLSALLVFVGAHCDSDEVLLLFLAVLFSQREECTSGS